MQIYDVVSGLAAGVGIDLSPDGTMAYYVEWSSGNLFKLEVCTRKVSIVREGLSYPEDVEVDWETNEIFVSERTGAIVRIRSGEAETIVTLRGAPHQLDLKKKDGKRYLYTVCYDSGRLIRIDVDARRARTKASGLGHPVGVVIDAKQDYAYVTEQDHQALTRIDLATGQAMRLYTKLVSPFFLAWDRKAKGIYCVQRDPANRLVRLTIGASSVTAEIVAEGLAWRPSGVAPSADDKKIYICADQELEVISFSGAAPIKSPKPPFGIHSIRFNYDKSAAIGLKDHLAGAPVPCPEYVKGTRNGPAAYLAGTVPKIRVVLEKRGSFAGGAYEIGATGSLGGVHRKEITPMFDAQGLSQPIDFELRWPLPGAVGKPDLTLNWYARQSPGPSVPVSVGSASHRIYLVLAGPTEPWVTETPWVAALELACGWAEGAVTVDEAATRITERFYNCGLIYDDGTAQKKCEDLPEARDRQLRRVLLDECGGGPHYKDKTFMFSEMIEKLNGGIGLGDKVICTDCANTVSTLANVLGCDLWQSRMGMDAAPMDVKGFALKRILAVGFPANTDTLTLGWPRWPAFAYHEVAWKGGCTENDRLFDGCLQVNDNDDENAKPVWVLPTNMLFGDCTTKNYRLRLSPPGPAGCEACKPLPNSTRKRRPIK